MNNNNHHQQYNKFRKETQKTNHPKSNNENNNNNDRFSSVKNSLQTCMGFMDGLCCANLNQVSAEDREEKSRAHLKDFMTSYDLSYLNSNFGDANNSTTGSSSNGSSSSNGNSGNSEKQGSMNHPSASESSSGIPSVEKGGTTYKKSTTPSPMMHNVLPSSMLPRDYGHSEESPTTVHHQEDHYQYDEVNSCCHSFSQFQADCQHDSSSSSYAQPRTLPSADTYTTVSLSQSYTTMMWDDEEDDDEEEEISSDYVLSPVDSVFRKDEHMEEASMERDGPPSCSPTPSSFPTSSIATKTHEAYQYLLRMKPQNYLHGSGSSEDLEYRGGELGENYCHSNRTNTSILGGDVNHQCGPLVFLQ